MSSSSNPVRRILLSNNTNSLVPSRSPSPQNVSSKPTASPALRRKVSFRKLYPPADSSEDPPSVHSSIFEAPYCSSSEGGDDGEKHGAQVFQIRAVVGLGGEEASSRAGETLGANALSICLVPRNRWTRLGGTPLETITERKSASTIRSSASLARTHSLDEAMPSSPQPRIADGTPPVAQAKRKHSFTFDDIIHLDCGRRRSSNSATDGMLIPPKEYYDDASPNMPTHNRPERIPTPLGLPSWPPSAQPVAPGPGPDTTDNSKAPRRRGLFFRSPSRRTPPPSGLTVSETPEGLQIANQRQFATAPGGRSRFRSPPSGYRSYGSLDMHPFHRAPLAKPWGFAAGSINGRGASSRPRSTTGTNAMAMQCMRHIQSSTNSATGATRPALARATNPPTLCLHMKGNQQNSPDHEATNATTTHPTNNGDPGHHPSPTSEDPSAKKCWRCRLNHWREQFSTLCCGDIGDYNEGAGFQNFSVPLQPANSHYNVARV